MKHTPGPWKAESYICHAPTTIRSATGIVVAECSGHGRHTDESLSDARLIAAAPEMLEALTKLSQWLVCYTLTDANDLFQSVPEMYQMIEQVIRKTEEGK